LENESNILLIVSASFLAGIWLGFPVIPSLGMNLCGQILVRIVAVLEAVRHGAVCELELQASQIHPCVRAAFDPAVA